VNSVRTEAMLLIAFSRHNIWGGITSMRATFKPVLGIALAAALAGCSHGASSVAPTQPGGVSPSQSQASHAKYFGKAIGDAAQVCGAVRTGEARCLSYVRTDITSRTGLSPDDIRGYHPADLLSAYNLPGGTAGAGETMAIVDAFDDPNAEADLAVYRSTFGLPECSTANGCFQKVNQFGQASPLPAADTTGWSEEESLDVDMASAICPNCHIILVEGNTNSFFSLALSVDTAVRLGADTVSNSYGGDESGYHFNKYYHQRHHIITASSGDGSYSAGPQFPAGSQFVIAVGGTHLATSSNSRGWDESAWRGAGSGCSAVVPKPSWQVDALCANRTIADVSAVADPATGVAVYDTYKFVHGWAVFGGTSVASPIIAAVYNLAGHTAGRDFAHGLYQAPANSLWDITTGSNGSCGGTYLCTGVVGYDGPTGMGTPNGVKAFK
jgi:subtilase family serine protease